MSFRRALAGLSALCSITHSRSLPEHAKLEKRSACDNGPWAPVLVIGGDGTPQCETKFGDTYAPITGLEVWQHGDDSVVAGVRFTYATGDLSQIYGHEDTSSNPSQSINLGAGETWTAAELFGNGKGQYLGHIHLETSGGKSFDAGGSTSGINPYGIETGGGILYGATMTVGGDDNDIVNLGFRFLGQAVKSVEVSDVQYTGNPNGSTTGIEPNSGFGGQWYNYLGESESFGYAQAYSVSTSHSFSQSSTSTFGISNTVTVSGGFFDIVDVSDSTEFSWSESDETASTTAYSTSTAVTCSVAGTLTPTSGASVTGTFASGNATFEYTSTVTVNLEDGSSFNYPETGSLVNVAFTNCTISTNPLDNPTGNNTTPLQPVPGGSSSSSITTTSSSSSSSSSSTPQPISTSSTSSVISTTSSAGPSTTGGATTSGPITSTSSSSLTSTTSSVSSSSISSASIFTNSSTGISSTGISTSSTSSGISTTSLTSSFPITNSSITSISSSTSSSSSISTGLPIPTSSTSSSVTSSLTSSVTSIPTSSSSSSISSRSTFSGSVSVSTVTVTSASVTVTVTAPCFSATGGFGINL